MMRLVVLFLSVIPALVFGQTSKEILAEALFEEEANGNLKGATEKYESLLKVYENERKIAAIALYRLAGIAKKKGDDKREAAIYRRLITEFAGVEPQERLARQELEAMGLKLPVAGDEVQGLGGAFD